MGLAFQNLQLFIAPDIRPSIEEKYKEAAAEAGEGDPTDQLKALRQQMRQIRNGERVDCLLVPMMEDTVLESKEHGMPDSGD